MVPLLSLPVMVNFMCHLDWTQGIPESWSNIISGSVPEGISGDEQLIRRLGKEEHPHQGGRTSPNLPGPEGDKKVKEGQILSLSS